MKFKDHFSDHSVAYRSYRPNYLPALFDYLASLSRSHRLAWDCATGNGQAALALRDHYELVYASDASAKQIDNAIAALGVRYAVACAERSGLDRQSVDLLSVAQAAHWLPFAAFYREADRVLSPGGVIAVWCYGMFRVEQAFDALVDQLYGQTLDSYWPAERHYVEQAYVHLPFPFREVATPAFQMEVRWRFSEVLGYLETWSAVRCFRRAVQADPLAAYVPRLRRIWGDDDVRRPVVWQLGLRAGYTRNGGG